MKIVAKCSDPISLSYQVQVKVCNPISITLVPRKYMYKVYVKDSFKGICSQRLSFRFRRKRLERQTFRNKFYENR